jgi:hypothetical protein
MDSRANPTPRFELQAGATGDRLLAASNAAGTGDTMADSNTFALALFALLVNSSALLSISM